MIQPFQELKPGLYWISGEEGWPAQFSAHSYIFAGEKGTVLIDPGCLTHKEKLKQTFNKLRVNPTTIIVTHEHWDHMTAADYFPKSEKAASLHGIHAINRHDNEVVHHESRGISYSSIFTRALEDGEIIDLRNFKLEILLTPGHTAGSLCIYEPTLKCLITGDTFFKPPMLSGIFESGSRAEHVRSLERLFKLTSGRGVDMIYPGHGGFIEGRPDCLDAIEEALELAREDSTNHIYHGNH